MVLVTGVTGSGKTSTIAAVLGHMNRHRASTWSRSRPRSSIFTVTGTVRSRSARWDARVRLAEPCMPWCRSDCLLEQFQSNLVPGKRKQ